MGEQPDGWWRDATLLKAEHDKLGSLDRVSAYHGAPSPKTLQMWWRKHGLPAHKPGPKVGLYASSGEPTDGDEWLLSALKKLGDKASVESLADCADVSPRRVRDALDRLGHNGYRVSEDTSGVVLQRVPTPSRNQHKVLFKGETYRFGIASDTHLGSNHQRLEELHMAYQVFKDEGITTVYHPGDLVCGSGIYKGQVNDIFNHRYEDQVEYAAEHYPKVEGITTYLHGGNHDLEGDFGRIGANPVQAVCNQRDDMTYCGDFCSTFELPQGTRIYVVHPKGGKGYALSYKMQKFAESFEGGSKPNVCIVGHYHAAGWFQARNIQVLYAGCFESGGDLGVRVPLGEPAVGFYIVEMTVADDGSVVKFLPRWHTFYAGRVVK